PGNPQDKPAVARSVVPLNSSHVGQEVAMLFETGNARRPIIMGLLQQGQPGATQDPIGVSIEKPGAITAEVDDERLQLTAEKEIVLRCGEASITLTRAGKILIRGTYVLSRSSGVNRVKGGSVQIN